MFQLEKAPGSEFVMTAQTILPVGSVVRFYGESYGKVFGYCNYTGPQYRLITSCGCEITVDMVDCEYLFMAA